MISDHPLAPSGVGTQTKYVIETLLQTGRYKFVCLGGAVKHKDYNPQRVEPYGEDLIVYPVDGYGNPEMIRSALFNEKPDLLWFMTDPRFYGWLWAIENEIGPIFPCCTIMFGITIRTRNIIKITMNPQMLLHLSPKSLMTLLMS